MAERFGRFWLHEKVGQGAMAEIYRATIGPDAETYAFDFAVKRSPKSRIAWILTNEPFAASCHNSLRIEWHEPLAGDTSRRQQ